MEIRLTKARIAFAHGLWKASAFEEGQIEKYGADFLIGEDTRVEKKVDGKWVPTTMKDAQGAVATEAFKGNKEKALAWFGDLESKQKAYRDGNKRRNGSGEIYDGYEGLFYITAKNKSRPLVLNTDKTPLTEADGVIYSGCYVNVTFDLYANTDPKRKGLFAGLKGVQFHSDGDSFGGGATAKPDDFDAVEGAAAADFA